MLGVIMVHGRTVIQDYDSARIVEKLVSEQGMNIRRGLMIWANIEYLKAAEALAAIKGEA